MQLPMQTFAIKSHQGNVSHDHESCIVYCKKRRNRRIYFIYENLEVRESIDSPKKYSSILRFTKTYSVLNRDCDLVLLFWVIQRDRQSLLAFQ